MLPTKLPDLSSREQKNKQIKDWNGSDFEKASSDYHPPKKIRFPLGVSLIAACCSDDKEEFKRLLELGVDINTRNPDGMTCVHQCCINGDHEFLEFLIEEGADLNVQDNEGWTPLHAAASVGYEELVRLLLKHGADVSLLSCETELPVDVAQDAAVTDLLNEAMRARGIDPVVARQTEAVALLNDAKHWVSVGKYDPIVDPRTGATPLHVAACKDYLDVLKLLLTVPGVDINCQDYDGWTPLHAAAHWNREQSARLLVEAGASFDVYSFTNQSVFDVADKQIVLSLRQLRERQRSQRQHVAAAAAVKPPLVEPERTLSPIPVDSTSSSEESEDSSTEDITADLLSDKHAPVAAGDVKLNGTASHGREEPAKRISPPPVPSSSVRHPSPTSKPTDDESTERTKLDSTAPTTISTGAPTVPIKPTSPPPLSTVPEKVTAKAIDALVNGPLEANTQPADVNKDNTSKPLNDTAAPRPTDRVSSARLKKTGREHSPPPVPPPRPARTMIATTAVTTPQSTTVNSSRIVTIRRKPGSISSTSSADSNRSVSPKLGDEAAGRRMSLLMSPAKSGETETQRSARARHVRSTRRSTQGISNEEMEEAKKLVHVNNNGTGKTDSSELDKESSPGVVKPSVDPTRVTAPTHSDGTQGERPTRDPDQFTFGRAIDSLSKYQRPSRLPTSVEDKTPESDDKPIAGSVSTTGRGNLFLDNRRGVNFSRNPESSTNMGSVRTPNTTNNYNSTDAPDRVSPLRDKPTKSPPLEQPSRVGSYPAESTKLNKLGSFSRDRWSNSTSLSGSIDYRRLYENEKMQKERLMKQLERYTREIATLRSQLARVLKEVSPTSDVTQTHHDSEEHYFPCNQLQNRLQFHEDQIKELHRLQEENAKMKEENGALIRVISKLSKPI